MRKLLIGGLAALTFGAAALPAPAALARDYRYGHGYYRYGHHRDNDDALVAGIAGLAIGAALASGSRGGGYYDNGYRYRQYGYSRGYSGRPYGYYGGRSYYGGPRYYADPGYYAYGGGYRRCRTTTDWDPWADAYIRRTSCW